MYFVWESHREKETGLWLLGLSESSIGYLLSLVNWCSSCSLTHAKRIRDTWSDQTQSPPVNKEAKPPLVKVLLTRALLLIAGHMYIDHTQSLLSESSFGNKDLFGFNESSHQ